MEKDTTNTGKISNAIIYGAIVGIALIIYDILLYMTGLKMQQSLGWLNIVLYAAGLFVAIRNYRNTALNGFISYGKAVGYGFFVSLFSSILLTAYTYLFVTVIAPDFIDQSLSSKKMKCSNKG